MVQAAWRKRLQKMIDKPEALPSDFRIGSAYTSMGQPPGLGDIPPHRSKLELGLISKKGCPLPGVDIDSRAKLYELMGGLD